jgi:hypothetical protein
LCCSCSCSSLSCLLCRCPLLLLLLGLLLLCLLRLLLQRIRRLHCSQDLQLRRRPSGCCRLHSGGHKGGCRGGQLEGGRRLLLLPRRRAALADAQAAALLRLGRGLVVLLLLLLLGTGAATPRRQIPAAQVHVRSCCSHDHLIGSPELLRLGGVHLLQGQQHQMHLLLRRHALQLLQPVLKAAPANGGGLHARAAGDLGP